MTKHKTRDEWIKLFLKYEKDKTYIVNKLFINRQLSKYEISNIEKYNKNNHKKLFKKVM